MKLIHLFIACLIILTPGCLFAQEAVSQHWSSGKAGFEYQEVIGKDSTPDELIIGLHDSTGQQWKEASWAQELSWIQDYRNATIIVPGLSFRELNDEQVEAFLIDRFPNVQSGRIRFIALGDGANSIASLLSMRLPGVLIAPMKSIYIKGQPPANALGILNSRSTDSTAVWVDSLERAGFWVKTELVIADDYYYIDQRKELILDLFSWSDSLRKLQDDSTWVMKNLTRMTSTIPEVVREGKRIEVALNVMEQGKFAFQLRSLNADVVFEVKTFLGKGEHRFNIPTKALEWGVYKLEIDGPGMIEKHRVMIRG